MEEWLRPAKKVVKPKATPSPAKKIKAEPADTNGSAGTPVKKPARPPKRTPTKSRTKRKAEEIESSPESELSGLSVDQETVTIKATMSTSRKSSRAKKVNYTEEST
ncbi:hypothetical protein N7509_011330 [Penicillium cosmopolitanum]|uniref:Uncharacterized protein n=1 Tax=Penicillium cosmopolitanum TaxID=1131564 RepID=A0A9X0B5C9_9EURO|nr:uncharacterized protein N7509_011330 [Penicillium cosmopolitanum]KAJ5388789.1 hypothetical protein N7509_011330 [Penicillium cosmopolitanum]